MATPHIFISYRRSDSACHSGRLYDRLRQHFDEDKVFIDLEGIAPAAHFPAKLQNALSGSKVLLVVIGTSWLVADDNRRRLDDPDDWVRREIELGLELKSVYVVPVLVGGAVMPGENDLPNSLKSLVKYQKYTLSDEHFGSEVDKLVESLRNEGYLPPGYPPDRRGLVSPLMAAGRPWSWLGWAVNKFSPAGAVAAAFGFLVVLVLSTYWATHSYESALRIAAEEENSRELVAQQQTCTDESLRSIKGNVQGKDGKAIQGARVSLVLTDPQHRQVIPSSNEGKTDSHGKFSFSLEEVKPPPKRGHDMILRVEAEGYKEYTKGFKCGELLPDITLLDPKRIALRPGSK